MGVSPAVWLVDKSVLARLHRSPVADVVLPRLHAGQIGVSVLTELEIGYSARSSADYRSQRSDVLDHLLPVLLPPRAEQRAREVQAELVARGQHRAVAVPDLLIAATAEIEGLTVLHYDADFDLVAAVTDQPAQWAVPRGSVA